MRSLLATAALGAGLGAVLFLVLAPSYTERSCTISTEGEQVCISASRTLVEENGDWVLAFVALPVALTAVVFASATGLLPLPRAVGWAAVAILLAGWPGHRLLHRPALRPVSSTGARCNGLRRR